MPAFWTEDPTIGNALAGLADSFSGKSQVAMASTIEDIKQKRALAEMRRQAQQRNQEMWNARSPDQVSPVPAAASPSWVDAGGVRGTEDVPPGGLQPLTAAGATDVTATSAAQRTSNAEFERVRRKQLADSNLGYQTATSMADVAGSAPKMEAQTQLDLYGVPKTVDAQNKMQTQLTGQLPMLDVKGTTNNWTATDPNTGKTISGQTRDGRTDLNTGAPLPPGALKMGDVSADQSPFKDTGAQLKALEALQNKVAIGQQPLSAEEKQRANILLSTLYPTIQKVEKDDAGNLRVIGYNEKVAPPSFGTLIAHLNQGIAPSASPATAGPSQPQLPAPAGAPAGAQPQVDPLAAIGPGITPPGSGPGPAAPQPIVPNPTGAPGVTVSPPVVQGSGDPQLKEVLNHPTVKGAMEAGRSYNELISASQAKTPEADLHMIYMLAKIYDPNSVVREGEVATASNTSPAMEKWWGLYNKQMQAGTQLSDRARASFLDEGYKAATAHYNAAEPLIKMAGDRATRMGLNPQDVMPPLSAPQRVSGAPAAAAAPAGRTEVTPRDREAIAWARANPRDPRASQILRQNGL